jgi:hypothetical protein
MPIVSRSLHQSRTKQNPHQSRRPSHAVLWSSSRQGKSKARRMNRSRVQGYRATSTMLVAGRSLTANDVAQRESAVSAQLVGLRCGMIARWLKAGDFGRFADESNGL